MRSIYFDIISCAEVIVPLMLILDSIEDHLFLTARIVELIHCDDPWVRYPPHILPFVYPLLDTISEISAQNLYFWSISPRILCILCGGTKYLTPLPTKTDSTLERRILGELFLSLS